jgi:hypothetical protein
MQLMASHREGPECKEPHGLAGHSAMQVCCGTVHTVYIVSSGDPLVRYWHTTKLFA